MDKKRDNIFINIIIFVVFISVIYYVFVMPEDLPVHSQMVCGALADLFSELAE